MNTKTEAILKAIRDANPELMELTRGCVIRAHPDVENQQNWFVLGKHGNFIIVTDETTHTSSFGENAGFQIIGHPPELRHLLVAMGMKTHLYISHSGNGFYFKEEETEEDCVRYELTLPLTENLEKNEALRDMVYEVIVDNQQL